MRDSLLRLMAMNRGKGRFEAKAEGGKAVIYLYDFIASNDDEAEWWGGVSPGQLTKALAEAGDKDVELRVNSPGGSVFAGRAMAAALKGHKGKVTAVIDGLAASAASFLVQAADRIEMSEGGMFMVHKAWTIALGNADAMRAEAEVLEKIDGQIAQTYAKAAERRGVEGVDFVALMAAETWLTADEALAAGLADGMADEPKQAAKAAAPAWDLSALKAKADEPALVGELGPEIVTPAPEPEPEPAADPLIDQEPSAPDHSNEIERRRRLALAFAYSPA